MTLGDVALRLKKVKNRSIRGCPGHTACCPAHEDINPSFAVWEGNDGWLHFKCQSGCSEDDILRSLGMEQSDRRISSDPKSSAPTPETVYPYRDLDGHVVFRKRRYYKLDRGEWRKSFIAERKEQSGWVSGITAIKRVLYRWPEVYSAKQRGATIYVHEGEKAADAFAGRGLVSTCGPFGADKTASKWEASFSEALRGAKVVIVADRDEVGEAYAKSLYSALEDIAECVRVVRSKTTGEKDDGYDHVQAGYGADDLIPAPDLEGGFDFAEYTFSYNGTFKAVTLDHLWDPFLPKGKPVLLDGTSGVGKSTFVLNLAAHLSNGRIPFSTETCEPVRTLYLSFNEDGADEMETVYRAAGGKEGALVFPTAKFLDDFTFDEKGFALLGKLQRALKTSLTVFDPLFDFAGVQDTNDAGTVTNKLRPYIRWMNEQSATHIAIRHENKMGDGIGSVMWKAKFRGNLQWKKHPTEKGVFVFRDDKGTMLNMRGDGMCFRRRGYEFELIENMADPFEETDKFKLTYAGTAEDFLREFLTEAKPTKDVLSEGRAKGFSQRTIERARKALGIKSAPIRPGGEWYLYPIEPALATYNPWEDVD